MAAAYEIDAMRYLHSNGFFSIDDEDGVPVRIVDFGEQQFLNLNDLLYPATADTEAVNPPDAPELVDLIRRYGSYGMAYWVLLKRGTARCAFENVNRLVEVIRNEEELRRTFSGSKYKTVPASYRVGTE